MEKIIEYYKQQNPNANIDKKGYFQNYNDNYIDRNLPTEIVNDLKQGNGNELESKFCAVHSSSALCVNAFAQTRLYPHEFKFENHTDFTDVKFEKKLSTKISMPNLDFYLENDKVIIGFESKYTEYFEAKIEHTNKNLQKYHNNKKLEYLPNGFMSIIQYYLLKSEEMNLDVAQLIKHTIGLINNKGNKKPILVYIYWQPTNWESIDICKKHIQEIEEFSRIIKGFIEFIPISYTEFWNKYPNEKVRKRYEQTI
ncbi:hypothetical protein FACS189426_04960 [Bacteroidia bacterium]|nr:hypothetical protein FACS189426_04960 [Bacteroidia bacterium]